MANVAIMSIMVISRFFFSFPSIIFQCGFRLLIIPGKYTEKSMNIEIKTQLFDEFFRKTKFFRRSGMIIRIKFVSL